MFNSAEGWSAFDEFRQDLAKDIAQSGSYERCNFREKHDYVEDFHHLRDAFSCLRFIAIYTLRRQRWGMC